MNEMARSARRRLLHRRGDLLGLVARNQDAEQALLEGGVRGGADKAQEVSNSAVLRSLTDRERQEVEEIDAALQRIEAGSYGRCVRCGGSVGKSRLAAVPQALTCVSCEEVAEGAR